MIVRSMPTLRKTECTRLIKFVQTPRGMGSGGGSMQSCTTSEKVKNTIRKYIIMGGIMTDALTVLLLLVRHGRGGEDPCACGRGHGGGHAQGDWRGDDQKAENTEPDSSRTLTLVHIAPLHA